MSMNQNPEDPGFDQLRRLLKIKRYEQPPPRYFNEFSIQVLARLRAGQGGGLADNWWQRLWSVFELKPALPAAFGAAICGLLVVGAVYTEDVEVPQELLKLTSGENGFAPTSLPLPHAPELVSFSTNPVPASGSLFDQIPLQPSSRASLHPLLK